MDWTHLSVTPLRIICKKHGPHVAVLSGLVKDSEVTGGMPPSGGINVVLTGPWLLPLKGSCHEKASLASLHVSLLLR